MPYAICKKEYCPGFVEFKLEEKGLIRFCPVCGGELLYEGPNGHAIRHPDHKFCAICGVKLRSMCNSLGDAQPEHVKQEE